jgi:sugar/nucleoside kinase (ribokinase family)
MTQAAPIVLLSNIIIDDVWHADGTHQGRNLGGAAVWAAIGARTRWPRVGIAAGVGADLETVTAGQLREFGLLPQGERVRDTHTIQSRLVYAADGTRTETPTFGVEHFHRMQLTPADIAPSLLPAAGTYVFRDLWPDFWRSFVQQREHLGYTLWELQDDAAVQSLWPSVCPLLSQVDIVSLNQAEGHALVGSADPDAMTQRLLEAGARLVVLRMGALGALISTATQRLHLIPPPVPVVDVTGAGNAFCGGFLAGWCARPGDLEQAARCGAAAAALCMAQVGLPAAQDFGTAPDLARAARVIDRTPRDRAH